jgi:hypothetical protein
MANRFAHFSEFIYHQLNCSVCVLDLSTLFMNLSVACIRYKPNFAAMKLMSFLLVDVS